MHMSVNHDERRASIMRNDLSRFLSENLARSQIRAKDRVSCWTPGHQIVTAKRCRPSHTTPSRATNHTVSAAIALGDFVRSLSAWLRSFFGYEVF